MQARPGSNILPYSDLVANTQEAWKKYAERGEARLAQQGLSSTLLDDFEMNQTDMSPAEKANLLTGHYLWIRHRILNVEPGKLMGYVAPAQGGYLNKGSTFLPLLETAINYAKLTEKEKMDALLRYRNHLLKHNPIEILREEAKKIAAEQARVNKLEAELAAAKKAAEESVEKIAEVVETAAVKVAEEAKKVAEDVVEIVMTEKQMKDAEAKRIAAEKKAIDDRKIAEHTRRALTKEELAQLNKSKLKAVELLSVFDIAKEINGIIAQNQAAIVAKKAALKSVQDRKLSNDFNKLNASVNKPRKDGTSKPETAEHLLKTHLVNGIKSTRPLKHVVTKVAAPEKHQVTSFKLKDVKEHEAAFKASAAIRDMANRRKGLIQEAEYSNNHLLNQIRNINPAAKEIFETKPDRFAVQKPKKVDGAQISTKYRDLVAAGLQALIENDIENAKKIAEAKDKELFALERQGLLLLVKAKKTTYEAINQFEREMRVKSNPQVIENEKLVKPAPVKFAMRNSLVRMAAAKWVPVKELATGNKVRKTVDANFKSQYVKTDKPNVAAYTTVSMQRLGEKDVTWRKMKAPVSFGTEVKLAEPRYKYEPDYVASDNFAKLKSGKAALNKTISDRPQEVPAAVVEPKAAVVIPKHVNDFKSKVLGDVDPNEKDKKDTFTVRPRTDANTKNGTVPVDIVAEKSEVKAKVTNPKDARPLAQQITAPSRNWGTMFSNSRANAIAALDAKIEANRKASLKAVTDAEKADLHDRQSSVRIR